MGPVGGLVVALSLMFFAFTTLVGWSYYGERWLGVRSDVEGACRDAERDLVSVLLVQLTVVRRNRGYKGGGLLK